MLTRKGMVATFWSGALVRPSWNSPIQTGLADRYRKGAAKSAQTKKTPLIGLWHRISDVISIDKYTGEARRSILGVHLPFS